MVDTEPSDVLDGEAGPSGPVVRTRWDGEDCPSLAVVRAVANASGGDPAALPPLQETLDTDALDSLADGHGAGGAGWTRISFEYADFAIIVDSEGFVEVWPRHSN